MTGFRILIVDDCPEDREVYRRLLSHTRPGDEMDGGFEFIETESGEEGLRILRSNGADCVLLDYSLPDVDGLEFLERLPRENGEALVPVVMLTGQGNERVAVQAMKGGAFDYLSKGSLTEEALRRAIENAREKHGLKRQIRDQQLQLDRLARFDELTGLLNRRAFLERLNAEVERSGRHGAPLGLLIIDLDHFKRVIDTHGHVMGDRVLGRTGDAIRTIARGTDFAGRYGGEEFCVGLPETDLGGAQWYAERMKKAVSEIAFAAKGTQNEFHVTCSIGVTGMHPELDDADTIVGRADQALQQAKGEGRNRVCVTPPEIEGDTAAEIA